MRKMLSRKDFTKRKSKEYLQKIWNYSHNYSFVSWFGVIVDSLTSGLKSVANGVGNSLKDLGKKYLKFFQV